MAQSQRGDELREHVFLVGQERSAVMYPGVGHHV